MRCDYFFSFAVAIFFLFFWVPLHDVVLPSSCVLLLQRSLSRIENVATGLAAGNGDRLPVHRRSARDTATFRWLSDTFQRNQYVPLIVLRRLAITAKNIQRRRIPIKKNSTRASVIQLSELQALQLDVTAAAW